MSSGKKLLLLGAVAFAIAVGFIAYSRSSATTDAPQPEAATVPVQTTDEIVPGGEPLPATPAADPATGQQPPAEPVLENGQPDSQNTQ